MKDRRAEYEKEWRQNRSQWGATSKNNGKITATINKYIGLSGDSSLDGDYDRDVNKVTQTEEFSDQEFLSFLEFYHWIQYDDVEDRFRGFSMYDIQKFEGKAETEVTTVRLQPTLKSGFRNVDRTPSAAQSIKRSGTAFNFLRKT